MQKLYRDQNLLLYNGYMLNHKKREPALSSENKQNTLRASSITTDTLNYKLNRTGGLIEKDLNGADRVKSLLGQNDELRKMSEHEKEKYKQEMAAMLKRTTKLEECIVVLENTKIEQEEEIQFLQKKLKENSDKQTILQQKHAEQTERYKNLIKELSDMTKRSESVGEVQKKNRELRSEVNQLKQKMSEKQNQNTELISEIKRVQEKWKSDINQLQAQLENMSNQKISLIGEYEQYMKKSEGRTKSLSQEIRSKNLKIQELQQKCKDGEQQMEEWRTKFEQEAGSRVRGKDQQLIKLKSELVKLKSSNINYSQELINLKKSLSQKQELLTELEAKIQQSLIHQQKVASTQIMNSTWRLELEAEFKRDKQRFQEKQRQKFLEVEKQIVELKSKIRIKQDYSVQLQESLTKWQGQYRKAAESRDAIETELIELKRQNLKLQQRLEDLAEGQRGQKEKQSQKEFQIRHSIEKEKQKMIEVVKQNEKDQQKLQEVSARVEKLEREKKDLCDMSNKLKLELLQMQKSSQFFQNESEKLGKKYEILLEEKIKLDATEKQGAELVSKCQKLQAQISMIKQQKLAIATELEEQKIVHEEILEEMEASREQYQKILSIQASKNQQFEDLTKCLKQKVLCYQQEYEKSSKMFVKRTKQLEEDKLRIQNKVSMLTEQVQKLQEQVRKGKKQTQQLRDVASNKQKEFERKLRLIEDEKAYLELENQKWKSLRQESTQQYEELKRENRKLKLSAEKIDETEEKLKQKLGIIYELEAKLKQNQQQKVSLVQKFEQQLTRQKSTYEIKMKDIKQENELLEEKIKAKISSDFQTAHREEVMRIRRKSEDSSLTLNRFEKKVQQLEIFIDQMARTTRAEAEGLKRQIEKKQRQIVSISAKYQQAKKKSNIILDELDDFSKKYREKQLKIEELTQKNKKYEENLSQICSNMYKLETSASKLEQQNKNFRIKNTALSAEVQKLESLNSKLTYQAEKIDCALKQIQKQKSIEEEKRKKLQTTVQKLEMESQRREKQKNLEEEKRKILEKKIEKLEDEQQKRQNQTKLSLKATEVRESVKAHSRQWEYESQIRKKAEELSLLKSSIEKAESQMRIMKAAEKNRKDIYLRLTGISNQHFAIEQRQNQMQFLYTLYEKIKCMAEVMGKIKSEKSTQNELRVRNQQLMKSCSKNLDENISIKDNYNAVYKKYLKYKEAYIYCKTKLERCKIDIVNDQRFTEEILSHCKTMITKVQ